MSTSMPCVGAAPSNGFVPKGWPKFGGKPACFLGEIAFPKPPQQQSGAGAELDLGPLSGAHIYLFGGQEAGSYKGEPVKVPHFALVELRDSSKDPIIHVLFQDNDVFFASKTEHGRLAALPKRDPAAHLEDPVWKAKFEIKMDAFSVLHDALKTGDICDELENRLVADYEKAGKPKPRKKWLKERLLPEYCWLKSRPRWVEDEGEWPSFLGQQMLFAGQVAVPDNDVATEYSMSDRMVYVFAGWSGQQTEFKLLQQDLGVQTAEQHYRAEELMALYLESPKCSKTIKRCVTEGDHYVHEFLLRQPGFTVEGLKLLAEKGANKLLREQAKTRLKG